MASYNDRPKYYPSGEKIKPLSASYSSKNNSNDEGCLQGCFLIIAGWIWAIIVIIAVLFVLGWAFGTFVYWITGEP